MCRACLIALVLGALGPSSIAYASNAWVKLCDSAPSIQQTICIVQQERYQRDGTTLVSVAVQQVAGAKPELVVKVPLGVKLVDGVQLTFSSGSSIKVPFKFCTSSGCTAQQSAPNELLDQLFQPQIIQIDTRSVNGDRLTFSMSLDGFLRAFQGAPVDPLQYKKARQQMLELMKAQQ